MRNFSTAAELRAGVRNLTLALAGLLAGTSPAVAQARTFSAYPVPGTLTASARTAIAFRGGDARALGGVTVSGSRSGRHAGTLRAHSDGQGVSFVPNRPFAAGER